MRSAVRACSGFLREAVHLCDEIFDLFRLQPLSVRWHLVLAVGDDAGHVGVALFLNVRRTKIAKLVCLAYGCFPFPVSAVASGTLSLVELLAWLIGT